MTGHIKFIRFFSFVTIILMILTIFSSLSTSTVPSYDSNKSNFSAIDLQPRFLQYNPDGEPGVVPDSGAADSSSRSPSTRASWIGEYKIVVICTEFPDKLATRTISQINTIVNTQMPDYYDEVSYEKFAISSTIVNGTWLMMPHNITYYTENDKAKFGEYVQDALTAADPWIDFNQYRTSGNEVKLLILVHTGQDEATSGDPLDIWSHMSQIIPVNKDNSWITQYCTVSEFSPMGVFAHEFGHELGLPDLYDGDYSSDGIGLWGIMGAGSHLNGGNTPAHFNAWCKSYLGWLTPTTVTSNLVGQGIPNVERNAVAYKVPIPITNPSSEEYFLIENRYKTGYDAYLPGSGLLIWHVDEGQFTSYFPNDDENHKMLDVEEASGTQHLDDRADGNLGDSSDLWSSNTEGFNPTSDPNSKSYSLTDSKFYLENIGSSGTTMTADFIVRHIYFEAPSNIFADPGSAVTFEINVSSDRASGDTMDFTLFTNSNSEWAELQTAGAAVTDEQDKAVAQIKITVPSTEYPNNFCEFYIKAHSTDDTEYTSDNYRVTVREYYSFSADEPVDVDLLPKDSFVNSFKFYNDGNVKTKFDVAIVTSSTWDIYFWDTSDNSPEVDPFSDWTLDVYVEIPESATADQTAQVTINIVSSGDSSKISQVFNVTVKKIYGLELLSSSTDTEFSVDPGSTLQYEYSLKNKGNTDDSVTISLDQEVVTSTLSEPWIFTLKPSSSIDLGISDTKKITLEITIPDASLAGVVHKFHIKVLSEDGDTNETAEIQLTVAQKYGMKVVLDSYSETAEPEEKIFFNFKITNTGNGNDTFNISLVSSLADGWSISYPSNADEPIGPGQTVKYSITITSPALAPAQKYDFNFKTKSLGDESLVSSFTEEVDIERVHSVILSSVTEGTLEAKPGEVLNYTVSLENVGNDDEQVLLSSSSIRHGLIVFKSSLYGGTITTLDLMAGESETIIVQFTVLESITESAQGALQIQGTLEDQSKTEDLLLFYRVNVTGLDPGPTDNGDKETPSSILSGSNLMAVIGIIVIAVILVIIIFFFVIKKGKGKKPQKADYINGNGTAAAYPQQPVVYDAQVVEAEVVDVEMGAGMPIQTEAVVGYDPQTGQPLTMPVPQQAPVAQFDPQTGEPLNALPESDQPKMRYDPQTGEPLEAEEEE